MNLLFRKRQERKAFFKQISAPVDLPQDMCYSPYILNYVVWYTQEVVVKVNGGNMSDRERSLEYTMEYMEVLPLRTYV